MALPNDFSASDSFALSDSATRNVRVVKSADDAITFADFFQRLSLIAILYEGLVFQDSASRRNDVTGPSLKDSLSFYDALNLFVLYKTLVTDNIALSERVVTGNVNPTIDGFAMADTVSFGVYTHITRNVSDAMSLLDTPSNTRYDNTYIRRYLEDVPRDI